ncbi:COMM domain-containing protein 4 [Balamuthia mandrillaris]
MKFRFCGELDAPDWLLKEIELLAKISSVRIKFLVKEVIDRLLSGSIDFSNVTKHTDKFGLSDSDVKAVIAALNFIVTNGAKYDVEANTLNNELQQLGLPKEHCDSLIRPFSERKHDLREKFKSQTLKLDRLQSVEWRVDYILSSSSLQTVETPTVQVCLEVENSIQKRRNESLHREDGGDKNKEDTVGPLLSKHAFEVPVDKFRLLLSELEIARDMMHAISGSNEELGLGL